MGKSSEREVKMRRDMIESVLWTFLASLAVFYALDLNTWVYLAAAVAVWMLVLLHYSPMKNSAFYLKVTLIFLANFLTFVLSKRLHGYHLLFDAEDKCCLAYGVLLGGMAAVSARMKSEEQKPAEEDGKDLFRERRFDKERLKEYLEQFSIVGVNGPWGSGKSFVTDHLDLPDYIFLKIDLLACNLDEIQTVLLNELAKVLKEQRIFSMFSPKIKKLLKRNSFLESVGQLLVKDDTPYSEAMDGLRNDLRKIKQTIVIVYEDLDRIDNVEITKKILSISEKIAGGNIKIIFQYDEKNLLGKELDRAYLEKYIPFTVNLTEISLTHIFDYLFAVREGERLTLKRKDLEFLERPVLAPPSLVKFAMVQIPLDIAGLTIRKTEHFLKEINYFLEKAEIYRENRREVILFFLLKHFYYDIYMKLEPGKSLLETFLFTYDGREDTLVNWYRYCRQHGLQVKDIFLLEENRRSALLISLFQYQCDIYELKKELDDIVNESVKNIRNRHANEQKDRIVWNLLCNGKSEYTNQRLMAERLQKEVLDVPADKQKEAFENLFRNILHGKQGEEEKGDNWIGSLMGVPWLLSLFQACRVAGLTGEQWITFVRFYLQYHKVTEITPELIEYLNYCELTDRKVYLFIVGEFNKLAVKNNMNSHKAYRTFLDYYLSALSNLGYVDTEEVWAIRNMGKGALDAPQIRKAVLEPLRKKLEDLKESIPIGQMGAEIELLIGFLDKNVEFMAAGGQYEQPATKVTTDFRSGFAHEKIMETLNGFQGDEESFRNEVQKAYDAGEITMYEIAKLERFQKKEAGGSGGV